MRAEKVVTALLGAASGVTNLVGTRIQPSPLPETITLPAIATRHVSTIDLETIDAQSYALVQSRIEVTAVTKSYVTQKNLLEQIRLALQYKRGTYAGVEVVNITRENSGPDLRDDEKEIFTQAIDFLVIFKET